MDIYIEYAVIDNMVINYLLLFSALKTLRYDAKVYRLLLSAALGTLSALLLPLSGFGVFAAFFFKAFTALLMVWCAGEYKRARRFALAFLLFLIYTFMLGGICIALPFAFKAGADGGPAFTLNYSAPFPLGFLVLAALVFYFVAARVYKYLFKRRHYAPFLKEVKLSVEGREYKTTAFLDTGNMLTDTKSGWPVVVVDKRLVKAQLAEAAADALVGRGNNLSAHYIPLSTASGAGRMLVMRGKLTLYEGEKENILERLYIGISERELRFDILLNPQIFGEVEA